jgi:hypothetical protein
MPTFGGEMRFTFNGSPLVLRGPIKSMPDKSTAEPIVNQDGSISRSLKPEGFDCEMTFEDAAGLDWGAIKLGGPYNVTVLEDQTGTIHTFQGALFFGRASVDRGTGEVSGLTLKAPSYRKLAA